jgi:hypothetical protein
MRKLIFLFFLVLSLTGFSQTMEVSGSVKDTAVNESLPNAVAIAVRVSDSLLTDFTRTDMKGNFSLTLPIDTYNVIISHPKFGDKSYFLFGSSDNKVFEFGKVILPPKSKLLDEVVIFAYKDPVYYKGDTLIYTADSFKVKPNATVEDLLKKLPGIKVDAAGKITAQGKTVDQVLVDGDEFFGTDPTTATKNLNATSVESVQVYDKKNENATDQGSSETIKVMDLKLKEEAKKGYFGKLSAASDFNKFYEGEFLANKFNNKQKVSVFALASNTPRSGFGWDDSYQYGLSDEYNMMSNEDGEMMWYSSGDQNQGVPQTLKTGFYYNNKISKKTKVNINYSFKPTQLTTSSETRSQYFLPDTTYTTNNSSYSKQANEAHSVNAGITQALDSLTELEFKPKFSYSKGNTTKNSINDFISGTDTLTRRTSTTNISNGKSYDIGSDLKLKRNFKKKDRKLVLSYGFSLNTKEADGVLKSTETFFLDPEESGTTIDQKKTSESRTLVNKGSATYTEPLNLKAKLEFGYDFALNQSRQDKKAFNLSNGDYILPDSLFTNSFENKRFTNRVGGKFIYELKKRKISVGARFRQISIENQNLITGIKLDQKVNNILPNAGFSYKFTDNKRLSIDYSTNSTPPDINQLAPLPDNSNPNRIVMGNPALRPSYSNDININMYSFKPISGNNFWGYMYLSNTTDAISNSITYDSIGRTISQPVNVKSGNINSSFNLQSTFAFFSKLLEITGSLQGNYGKSGSYINLKKNITQESSVGPGLEIQLEKDEVHFEVAARYSYSKSSSSLSTLSEKPYTEQEYSANFSAELPLDFRIETDATYTLNQRRTAGYNINYIIWNASLNKSFFKRKNFIISVEAMDMLNQNISTNRTIADNVITDTKTSIIGRYILFKAMFKFNSNKDEGMEEDEE